MGDSESRINDFIENFKDSTPHQYGHGNTDMEIVMNNPEEYIIPECLPACKELWAKNIFTYMVSNYDNVSFYIQISPTHLSEENMAIMYKEIKENPDSYGFTYNKLLSIATPRNIREKGIFDKDAADKLVLLTDPFVIQDTLGYEDPKDFLWAHKNKGEPIPEDVDKYGNITIRREEDPSLSELTLKEALQREGKEDLYVEEEGRVYKSPLFLAGHQRYLNAIKSNTKNSKN
jgi:hypothetical protein